MKIQIEESVKKHYDSGLTEIHVVGGLWRDCNLDYYASSLFRTIWYDGLIGIY